MSFIPQVLSKDDPQIKLDQNLSDENIQRLKDKLKQEGVLAVSFGVVGIPDDEEGARKIFVFAKNSASGRSPPSPRSGKWTCWRNS